MNESEQSERCAEQGAALPAGKRRLELLEKLRADKAPPAAIAEAEKKLKLTQLRLRRLAPEENKKE